MSKKLYIGNLSYEVTEEDLKKNFGEIGECIVVNIIRDKYSGNSRGFGFVEMTTEEEAQEAIRKLRAFKGSLKPKTNLSDREIRELVGKEIFGDS